MITTICFDLGEVILTNDWTFYCPQKDKEFQDFYGLTEFNYATNPYTQDLFTGKISERNFWIKALALYHAKTTDPSKAIELARTYQAEKPGMFRLLRVLKEKGYVLDALTNTHKELLEWKEKKFHLNEYFSHIVSSCVVGVSKPDRQFFEYARKTCNFSFQECVFIDDNASNVTAAVDIGMKGIIFTTEKTLIKTFKTLDIIVE